MTRASALSSALRGDRVAVTLAPPAGTSGSAAWGRFAPGSEDERCADARRHGLWAQRHGADRHDLRHRRPRWRLSCGGDPSACEGTRAGPFRQTAAGLAPGDRPRVSDLGLCRRDAHADRSGPPAAHDRRVLGGPDGLVSRCDTVTAVAEPSYRDIRPPRENLPPPGYVTVKGTSRLLVLRPPRSSRARAATHIRKRGRRCGRGELDRWRSPKSGPPSRTTATSGGRTVKGTVPEGAANHEGQITTTLDLGGTSKACDRTWTLTYRPPKAKPIRFTTRVLGR